MGTIHGTILNLNFSNKDIRVKLFKMTKLLMTIELRSTSKDKYSFNFEIEKKYDGTIN